MTEKPWSIGFTGRGKRDMARLDPQIRRRIAQALDRLAGNPDEATGVRRLAGRAGDSDFRIRVGDWRVIFETDRAHRQVIVHRILPRGRAYDR
jgi:mRNA-degrading endonuclease RelE of RelBE toxin-antitoxin system